MNAENWEEDGGRCCGAANCSRLTAHSVGKNAGGFCFWATWAHVQPIAMVNIIDLKTLFYYGERV